MKDVSIIIVNYHSENLIQECIKSVLDKTNGIQYEIIIVDNESDEQGKQILRTLAEKSVKIIDAKENLGFGKANNLGAESAQGKYLFLLNPDTILVNNAVKVLYDFAEENENVGVCGGNLYTPGGEPVASFCKEFDTLEKEKKDSGWLRIIHNKIRNYLNKNSLTDVFNYSDFPIDVAYVFGADMLIKKDLFDYIGGFDKDFFMYAEEAELQNRVTKMGYRIVCVPQSKIIHLEGATSTGRNGSSYRQFAMRMKGRLTYYDKCFPPNGAKEFYKYRRLKMYRLMQWQKLKGRKPSADSIETLDRVFAEYCNERRS